MLDGRVKTLHPKIHGGLLADLGNETHRRDLDLHGILPFELVVSNLYPFEQRPDIETIDIGGPAMTRAAAKNHAWVTIVTSPDQYGPLLDELHANDGTVGDETAPRVRARSVRAHRRVRRRDRAVARRTTSCCPQHLVLALERTDETLRYGENPHQQGARYRRAGTTSWWDGVAAARGPRALVPQLLRHRRGVEARARSRRRPGVRHHQARQPVRRRARRHARRRVPACARVRRAVRVRRDRRAEPPDRHRDRRAHGRGPAGRRRHRAGLRGRA